VGFLINDNHFKQTSIMKEEIFYLIKKYARLLVLLSILSFAFGNLLDETPFQFDEDEARNQVFKNTIFILFNLSLNIITALFVNQDIRKYKIRTQYVLMATVAYKFLGVFAFLMFAVFQFLSEDLKLTLINLKR
jgi:hypothetical protein